MKREILIGMFATLALSPALFVGAANGAAPAPADGNMVFRQRCQMCHGATSPRTLGPSIAGVVGRKAASTTFAYSPALKKSGLTWTAANLDKYLTAPTKLVPGTKMVVTVPDKAQRDALIKYLATVK